MDTPDTAKRIAREAFFSALESLAGGSGQVFYEGPFTVIGDREGGVLGTLEVRVSRNVGPGGALGVRLGFLSVLKENRRKGNGTRLLRLVLDAADRAGLPVDLTVSPQAGFGEKRPPMTKAQLRAFYTKHGFVRAPGQGPDDLWRPVPAPAAPHVERPPAEKIPTAPVAPSLSPLTARRRREIDALARRLVLLVRRSPDVQQGAAKLGAEVVAAGANRAVFRIPEGALKVEHAPTFGHLVGNAAEAQVWDLVRGHPEIRRLLVPVLATSDLTGDWLLMEYAPSTGRGRMKAQDEAFLSRIGFFDLDAKNLGDDGRVLDYDFVVFPKLRAYLQGTKANTVEAMRARPIDTERYPWLPVAEVQPWVGLMERDGVSEVARSPRGFLHRYLAVQGQPGRMGPVPDSTPGGGGYPWAQRRDEFISRHMAQVTARGEPLWRPDGRPTRRHLGLIAWAYSPDPDRLAEAPGQSAG